MKNLRIFIFILIFNLSFAESITNYLNDAPFVLYAPSWKTLNNDVMFLMKKFYDKNFTQIKAELEAQSKANFGINIFNDKELDKIGINISKPLAYVHYSNDIGYILIPVKSQKTLSSYLNKNMKDFNYKFFGDYVAIGSNKKLLNDLLKEKKLLKNDAFNFSLKKLNYKWDKHFLWVDSTFISDVTKSKGVTENINVPYGFTFVAYDVNNTRANLNLYMGLLSDDQKRFLASLKQFNATEKINFMDYIPQNPSVVLVANMNMALLYKYYQFLDKVDILGIRAFANSIEEKYKVSIEKDIFFNGDGRLRLIFDSFDQKDNKLSVYGIFGLNNVANAKNFINNLNAAILKNNEKVYSFEMFTYPFYRYPVGSYSVFYGIIENDLVFSTDRDKLTNIVQKIFRKEGGYLENAPEIIKNSTSTLKPGANIYIDIQNLLANLRGELQLNPSFFVNLKDITLSSTPDDENGYGWNVDLNLYWVK